VNRADFQKLALIRLEDARTLVRGGRWEAAYYLSGYVIECALKACIARSTKRYDFPERSLLQGAYTHDLTQLLRTAKLESARDEEFQRDRDFMHNWQAVQQWTEHTRYGRANEGRRFLELLQNAGVPLRAALWERDLFDRWDLVLVTPWVDELGVKGTFRKLDDILRKSPDRPAIDLLDVSVLTPQATWSRDVLREFRRRKNVSIESRPVGDHFISEAYLYFAR
jgi:HEPN domain-containing protein